MTLTKFEEKYKLWSSSLRKFFQPPVTLSLLQPQSVRNQVSHPYKTTGRIIVLKILSITFLDSRREDKIF
jgi:hypothetical protein